MPYITEEYYYNIYHGEPLDSRDFPSLYERAVELVEEMCGYRVCEERIDFYGEATQERIRKAICAQMEYLNANGGADMDNGAGLQSASLGKFSYTTGGTSEVNQPVYASRARRILAPTGLLYRGGRI